MTPVWAGSNQVGVANNGIFNDANTDPIPGGILWNGSGSWAPKGDLGAALSWNDMRAYIGARHAVWILPAGSRSSARLYSDQVGFYNNQPPPAAFPGTSNHGWAVAVDVLAQIMAAYILRYGPMFGWSWDEGRRVGEWWHFRYIGGYRKRITIDPLTKRERSLVDSYAKLPSADLKRRDRILDTVADQIRTIRRQAEHERNGWSKHERTARYKELTEWFNGEVAPRFLTAREREWKMAYYGADDTQKNRLLVTLRAHADDLLDLSRRRGSGGWTREHRGDRYQHLSRFVAHRR